MSSSLLEVPEDASEGGFDIRTTDTSAGRANLRARGILDSSSAPVLAEVIAGHVRAGRRFLRLDLADLRIADPDALEIVRRAHHLVLRARGTLILTRVPEGLRATFARAGLDTELFILPPSAYEATRPDD